MKKTRKRDAFFFVLDTFCLMKSAFELLCLPFTYTLCVCVVRELKIKYANKQNQKFTK